ncbi:MAG: outer membrane lipoprotein-sorting protein [Aquirufa sp.]
MKKIILSLCFGVSTLFVNQLNAQTTEEILVKHEAAMGSPEKWASIKSAIVKNKFSVQGMDIESKTTLLVGKAFRTEVEVMGNKIITAIEGDKGWMIRPAMMGGTGEAEDMPAEQIKMADSQKQLGSILSAAKSAGSKIELVSKEKLDGADVFLLTVTKSSGETMQVYVSASTYFVLKTTGKVKANGQEIDTETNFSNYKAVDGLYFPFTVEAASPMGGMMQIDTTGVELNASVDPAIFARPKK